jgi:hypothetical protein
MHKASSTTPSLVRTVNGCGANAAAIVAQAQQSSCSLGAEIKYCLLPSLIAMNYMNDRRFIVYAVICQDRLWTAAKEC